MGEEFDPSSLDGELSTCLGNISSTLTGKVVVGASGVWIVCDFLSDGVHCVVGS